jgi:hypothetical protein
MQESVGSADTPDNRDPIPGYPDDIRRYGHSWPATPRLTQDTQLGSEDSFPLANDYPNHRALAPVSEEVIANLIKMTFVRSGRTVCGCERLYCSVCFSRLATFIHKSECVERM